MHSGSSSVTSGRVSMQMPAFRRMEVAQNFPLVKEHRGGLMKLQGERGRGSRWADRLVGAELIREKLASLLSRVFFCLGQRTMKKKSNQEIIRAYYRRARRLRIVAYVFVPAMFSVVLVA